VSFYTGFLKYADCIIRNMRHMTLTTTFPSPSQWRKDGVAAASSDGGLTGVRRPPTVLEFLVINFSVCLVLLSNCYKIIYCII